MRKPTASSPAPRAAPMIAADTMTYLFDQAKAMEKLDIPPVREFLELISDSGGKIFACKLAMDMFKLKKEDLMDRVDGVLTVKIPKAGVEEARQVHVS